MKGWKDERMKGWKDERMKGWINERMKGWKVESMKGWKDERMKGWKDERMKGWDDERLKGWKDERMNQWKDELINCLGEPRYVYSSRPPPWRLEVSPATDLSWSENIKIISKTVQNWSIIESNGRYYCENTRYE